MIRGLLCICCFLLATGQTAAQSSAGLTAKFSFDQGSTKNEITSAHAKVVGATLTEDRFGNPASAYYFHGNIGSYINLGTDASLKPAQGSVSLWFRMDNIMYAGSGYEANPIMLTKVHTGNDFFESYCFSTDFTSKRLVVVSSNVRQHDTAQACVRSNMRVKLAKWYHAVLCYNDSFLYLYVNGELQNKIAKNFRTKFLAGDSVMLGHTANKKNARYFNGTIDDIAIYNRVLTPEEVRGLYDAPDPNRSHMIIRWLAAILAGALAIVLLMLLLLKRERIKNRKQRQVYEMEMQIIKAQMNPHFIFNAINSVQQFILANDNDNAHRYLVKFSRLLRMILESSQEDHITLENEIDVLTRYIEIEALRFERSFTYEVITDAGINTSKIKLPQMLVQPLVENAIWHGLLPKKGNRKLSIKFTREDPKTLLCIIDDNGVGRRARGEDEMVPKRKSLAISFIYQRLDLMSREGNGKYGIRIIDKTDEYGNSTGTRVIIKMPILTEQV